MLILALDTSSASGSAAVVEDGHVLVERAGDPSRTHAERLPRELMDVLDAARRSLDDVDALAVVTGPGSFTGLRVGLATMQGLAFARGLQVFPVSAFEALARDARGRGDATGIWIDAHRGEVFAVLVDSAGQSIEQPSSRPPARTLHAWDASLHPFLRVHFCGDGAVKYASVIIEQRGSGASVADTVPLLAGITGRIAAADPGRGVAPHAVVPQYVRRPDAELARDRRKFD